MRNSQTHETRARRKGKWYKQGFIDFVRKKDLCFCLSVFSSCFCLSLHLCVFISSLPHADPSSLLSGGHEALIRGSCSTLNFTASGTVKTKFLLSRFPACDFCCSSRTLSASPQCRGAAAPHSPERRNQHSRVWCLCMAGLALTVTTKDVNIHPSAPGPSTLAL